jgi:glycosyltransferase involved in cell wall biosynthesis
VRILFAAPVWWPSRAFGGPVVAARELVRRLVDLGHDVDVVTTTIVDLVHSPARRSSTAEVDGATVHYLATPFRYRWMGITPTLPLALEQLPRPDVAHVFGFRDVVTTGTAAWCRVRRIPYVFEPLGMFEPRLRKLLLKRALDASLYRGVARGAAAVVVASDREHDSVVANGIEAHRVHVRGNGFPSANSRGPLDILRSELGIEDGASIVLYVGRLAAGKGIDHLQEAARRIPEAHFVFVGPDDRHGLSVPQGPNIHVLPPTEAPPFALYCQADVFVLPSAGESFGMVAAEAAASGTAVIVSDRCGIVSSFRDGEALVVPYEREAIVSAVERVLSDDELREGLSRGGKEAANRMSWDEVTHRQEAIYGEIASRTAATKFSTDAS